MLNALKQKFRIWLFRHKIEHGTVTLTQRRIFIIPTRQGFILCSVLVLMLLGDINYNLSHGYVLTFLLTMMAVMPMLHAFRNRSKLQRKRVCPICASASYRFQQRFFSI